MATRRTSRTTRSSRAGSSAAAKKSRAPRTRRTRATHSQQRNPLLRVRAALELFLQQTLSKSENQATIAHERRDEGFAQQIWRETLLLTYRLLAVLRVETSDEFQDEFAWLTTPDWRQRCSLCDRSLSDDELVHRVRRTLRLLCRGGNVGGYKVSAWGGRIFARDATPLLDRLHWDAASFGALFAGLRSADGSQDQSTTPVDVSHLHESLLDVAPAFDGDSNEFALRGSTGRKGAGAYYTPSKFVRFLVEYSLGATLRERRLLDPPDPAGILRIKVLDPAMGTGLFLLEACRYLGRELWQACRDCLQQAGDRGSGEHDRWLQKVVELPEVGPRLVALLQQDQTVATTDGVAPAERLCRSLVAMHCLHGVDQNPISTDLARLLLWLEAGPGLIGQDVLSRRLLAGDSLTGPFLSQLQSLPSSSDTPMPAGLLKNLRTRIRRSLTEGRRSASPHGNSRHSSTLPSLQVLAAAWSGGAQFADERCSDAAWTELAAVVAEKGELPHRLDRLSGRSDSPWDSQPLHAMLARGLGIASVPKLSADLIALIDAGNCVPAVDFERAFPEVFRAQSADAGEPKARRGFDVVLGNPPWDAIRPHRREFFSAFDHTAGAAHSRKVRRVAEANLLKDARIATAFANYAGVIEGAKRAYDRLYSRQKLIIDGDLAGRYLDQYRVFLERKSQLVALGGRVSVIVPASFRANAGAVGLRQLYLLENQAEFLFTFHNRRQTFDIATEMQFSLLSTRFGVGAGVPFETATGLENLDWLFAQNRQPPTLRYPPRLLTELGGPHLAVANFAEPVDLAITERLLDRTLPLGQHPLFKQLPFQTNPAALNATTDFWRLEATDAICKADPRDPAVADKLERAGFVPLHEKGTIGRYVARERQQPRFLVNLNKCSDKPSWLTQRRHFRLMGRSAIHAAEEDKNVFALIPPGGLVANSALVEAAPENRSIETALSALAILNSYVLNYLARQQVVLNLNLFIFRNLRVPSSVSGSEFLARAALRLSAQDSHFAPLWKGILGDAWHEQTSPQTWPAMADGDRALLIADVNAAVALAYGLTHEEYLRILELGAAAVTAAERELASDRYSELLRVGLKRFVEQNDPYARSHSKRRSAA